MNDEKLPVITADELAEALGQDFFPRARALVLPIWHAQREAIMLIDKRESVLGDLKLAPDQRIQKLNVIEAALRQIISNAVTLSAYLSLPYGNLVTLAAAASKSSLSAAAVKEFLSRTDRWTGPFLPETLKDWATAIGLPAGSNKKTILARLVELDTARTDRDREAYHDNLVSTFSVNELRLSVALSRCCGGKSDSRDMLPLVWIASELKRFITLARPAMPAPPAPPAITTFGMAPPLLVTFGASGVRAVQ